MSNTVTAIEEKQSVAAPSKTLNELCKDFYGITEHRNWNLDECREEYQYHGKNRVTIIPVKGSIWHRVQTLIDLNPDVFKGRINMAAPKEWIGSRTPVALFCHPDLATRFFAQMFAALTYLRATRYFATHKKTLDGLRYILADGDKHPQWAEFAPFLNNTQNIPHFEAFSVVLSPQPYLRPVDVADYINSDSDYNEYGELTDDDDYYSEDEGPSLSGRYWSSPGDTHYPNCNQAASLGLYDKAVVQHKLGEIRKYVEERRALGKPSVVQALRAAKNKTMNSGEEQPTAEQQQGSSSNVYRRPNAFAWRNA